jgi:predicted DNA-binding ribbon-helix-helix protein
MNRLPENHPEVQRLVEQVYEQREQVGKISSFVGFMNMNYLLSEIRHRGWIARLSEDGQTIYLEPVQE